MIASNGMKKTLYKDKPKKELVDSLKDKRASLVKLRFQTTGSRVKNVKEIKNLKRDIARVMTELNRQ